MTPSQWLDLLVLAVAFVAAVSGWPLLGIIPAIIALGAMLALHESRPKEPQPD